MPAFVDITAHRFGRWTVLRRVANNRHNQPQWLCRCACGNEGVVRGGILASGSSRSCGCLNRDVHRLECIARNTTHGHSGSPTYRTWRSMIQRCHRPGNTGFHKYGAKGISVAPEWRESFERFLADMGEKPPGLTIDRIDARGNYEPGNCRWATMRVQQNNRTNNRILTHNGLSLTVAQWARHLGRSRTTIERRLEMGMPLAEALAQQKRSRWRA